MTDNKPTPSAIGSLSVIALPCGRSLAYAEYGSPDGTPVLFFHGFPASHKEAALWHDTAKKNSVRLIAPDRPGIGTSTYQLGRRVLDWPQDVAELVQNLQLDGFRILAVGGGSPYALGCLVPNVRPGVKEKAQHTSRLQIRGTAIVSGIYPMSLGTGGMQISTRIVLWILGHCWFLLVPLLEWLVGRPARENPKIFESRLMKEGQGRPIVDKKVLADVTYRHKVVESARHAFICDARGVAHEAGLMGRPWGFKLGDISDERARLVSIWQGGFDAACPADMAKKAHEALDGSSLRVLEYEGHLSLPAMHQDEIMKGLIGLGQ
jgi:pimeloyl-ACP methyl ester carboxylesterase